MSSASSRGIVRRFLPNREDWADPRFKVLVGFCTLGPILVGIVGYLT